VSSLPKTVTRQRRDCDLNPGPSALESSTLTTRLPSHPRSSLYRPLSAFKTYAITFFETLFATTIRKLWVSCIYFACADSLNNVIIYSEARFADHKSVFVISEYKIVESEDTIL